MKIIFNKGKQTGYYNGTDAVVVDEGGVRIFRKDKEVDIENAKISVTVHQWAVQSSWQIMVMVNNVSLIYNNLKKEEADTCMTYASAEFASKREQLTVIIAYLEAIRDIKSFSTLMKTLSGSAISATWRERLTPTSTEKSSGNDSAKSTDENTWSDGLKVYHSVPTPKTWDNNKKYYVRVTHLPRKDRWNIGITGAMMAKQRTGEMCTVRPYGIGYSGHRMVNMGDINCVFPVEWVTFYEPEETLGVDTPKVGETWDVVIKKLPEKTTTPYITPTMQLMEGKRKVAKVWDD